MFLRCTLYHPRNKAVLIDDLILVLHDDRSILTHTTIASLGIIPPTIVNQIDKETLIKGGRSTVLITARDGQLGENGIPRPYWILVLRTIYVKHVLSKYKL
jgi:hypothetical protein